MTEKPTRVGVLSVSLAGQGVPGAPGPVMAEFRGGRAWSFSASTQQDLCVDVRLPPLPVDRNDPGPGASVWSTLTRVRPVLRWSPGESTNTVGAVRWAMEASWAGTGDAFPTPVTLASTEAATGPWAHQTTPLGLLVPPGGASVMVCRIARLGGAAADTFTGVAFALTLDLVILTTGPGTETSA